MLKQTCLRCGGRGKFQTIGTRNCNQCMGTGRDLTTNVINSPFNPYCKKCNGRRTESYYEWKTCNHCNGRGYKIY
jgi:DnaJ-class molecular chaperone